MPSRKPSQLIMLLWSAPPLDPGHILSAVPSHGYMGTWPPWKYPKALPGPSGTGPKQFICCLRFGLGQDGVGGFTSQELKNEINPEYSLEGLILKLKLQYFDHLIQRTDSLEKTQRLGKI